MKVKSESEVTQSCTTLSDSMDCNLPGSFVHGIFQAGVLEWGAIAFSGRKAKGLQMEEISCIRCFFISVKQREEANNKCHFFFLLYTNLKEISFKILCCHDYTWFHPNLSFLKP